MLLLLPPDYRHKLPSLIMPLYYRNLPRLLQLTAARDQQFIHSAASQLVRIEPFRLRATTPADGSAAATTAQLLPLTQVHAFDVVTKLNASEREALRQALDRFELDTVASKLEGEHSVPVFLCIPAWMFVRMSVYVLRVYHGWVCVYIFGSIM